MLIGSFPAKQRGAKSDNHEYFLTRFRFLRHTNTNFRSSCTNGATGGQQLGHRSDFPRGWHNGPPASNLEPTMRNGPLLLSLAIGAIILLEGPLAAAGIDWRGALIDLSSWLMGG